MLLGCYEFSDNHTSLNLSTKIKSTLIEWNLEDKIIFAISDNANNIKAALNLLQLKHFGCFAHTLNLIVQSALSLEIFLIKLKQQLLISAKAHPQIKKLTHAKSLMNQKNKKNYYETLVLVGIPLCICWSVL